MGSAWDNYDGGPNYDAEAASKSAAENRKKRKDTVRQALRAASQMRLALAGEVSFDTAANAWDNIAEEARQALEDLI
jgi:hypothetical protein